MWSRRDQIQAYQFLRRRIVSAVLVGDANHADSPTRLQSRSTITGFAAMVLMLAGFGVYGYLRPGSSTAWQDERTIIEEKGSGALFVLLDGGGTPRLHPVLNFTSARLIVGNGDLTRQSSASLGAAPRGPLVGIPGAPDSLPAADRISGADWTSCGSLGDPETEDATRVTMVAGLEVPRATPLDADDAVLATAGDQTFLVTAGLRFLVSAKHEDQILRALGLDLAPRARVAAAWLEGLPPGPDLDFPDVTGFGEVSSVGPFAESRVGQIYTEDAAAVRDPRFFVLEQDGLAQISAIQATLALADPDIRDLYGGGSTPSATPLSVTDISNLPVSRVDREPGHYPVAGALTSALTPEDQGLHLCATPASDSYGLDGAWAFDLSLVDGDPLPADANAMPAGADQDAATFVATRSGGGALVRSSSQESHVDGMVYLVTDQGARFAVPDTGGQPSTLETLGYGGLTPVVVPDRFLSLVPEGPVLDPEAALTPRVALPTP